MVLKPPQTADQPRKLLNWGEQTLRHPVSWGGQEHATCVQRNDISIVSCLVWTYLRLSVIRNAIHRDHLHRLIVESRDSKMDQVPRNMRSPARSAGGEDEGSPHPDELPACLSCRRRKSRCSRERPSCAQCLKIGNPALASLTLSLWIGGNKMCSQVLNVSML